MSTLGGLISYACRSKSKSRRDENWLPKEQWVKKMKDEGRWVDHKKDKFDRYR